MCVEGKIASGSGTLVQTRDTRRGPWSTTVEWPGVPTLLDSSRRVAADEQASLPLVAYYSTQRLWSDPPKLAESSDAPTSIFAGYEGCLDTTPSGRHFENWMRWRTEVHLQQLGMVFAPNGDPASVQSPHLDAITHAVVRSVEGARAFRYDIATRALVFTMDDGRELPFHLLSDGYRNAIAMVADIAWRAVVLNPHFAERAPEQVEGVVLIDEIDLHLHPKWQRTIIATLRKIFPKVQSVEGLQRDVTKGQAENPACVTVDAS